nr:hypothetical protein [Tanacetum cinerariifolium]
MDKLMLRVFPITLTGAASRWLRNEPAGSITTWEILKGIFLNKYCPPSRTTKRWRKLIIFSKSLTKLFTRIRNVSRHILNSKGSVPTIKADDAKKAIPEMADYSKKWHNGTSTMNKSSNTSDGLVAI